MPLRFAPLPLSLLLAFAALPGHAQNAARPAPPARPAGTPAAPDVAIVDPAARRLFSQMVAAHRALRSFAVTIDAQDENGNGGKPLAQSQSRIEFDAPARASVVVREGGRTVGELFSDGATLTKVDARHKEYQEQTLPAAAAPAVVTAGITSLGLLPQYYADPLSLLAVLNAPGLVAFARGAADGRVNGVPVDSVVARIIGSDGAEGTFTFVIGRGDHLLRQVVVQETPPTDAPPSARRATHRETVAALESPAALPTAAFAYAPEPGFKKLPATP